MLQTCTVINGLRLNLLTLGRTIFTISQMDKSALPSECIVAEDKALTPQATMLVYLDHSALNLIDKERRPKIREMLTRPGFQVVYSDENLSEISKSIGFEQKFLSLLSALNAKHLRLVLDDRFRYTERASLETTEPAVAYAAYIANRNDSPSFDGGLRDLLKKLYGDHPNKSFEQILQSGGRELINQIEALAHELSSNVTVPQADVEAFARLLPDFNRDLTSLVGALAQQFDAGNSSANVKAIDEHFVLGPTVLNNLTGPGIVQQIWTLLAKKSPDAASTCDEFFGAARPCGISDDEPWTKLQQVNAVYHQLNFLGYWRDENMNKRFDAHFNDLTHVGMASLCHAFLTGDKRQFLKTAATYEHLDIKKILWYLKP